MCYYNGQKISRSEMIRLKQLEKAVAQYDFLHQPLTIGFDYGLNAVCKPVTGQADFDIVQMEWGFIPHYIHDREALQRFRKGGIDSATGKFIPPILTLNAIGEELFQKVTYRKAALERRCLVLSSGFYEWRHIFPANKKTGKPLKTAVKYPYHIHFPNKPYFFMAGIWTPWTDKNTGEYVESFAIITTRANPLMEQVHNNKKRMPVILDEALAYEWMFGNLEEARITEIATTQCAVGGMEAYPIANKFITALQPEACTAYPELPPLVVVG